MTLSTLETVKYPSFTRLILASLIAYWLSGVMQPAFVGIAWLILVWIPILRFESFISKETLEPPELKTESEFTEIETIDEHQNIESDKPKEIA